LARSSPRRWQCFLIDDCAVLRVLQHPRWSGVFVSGGQQIAMHVASTTKVFFVAGGFTLSLAGYSLFGGVGLAVADGTLPDTGTYDEMLFIVDEDGFQSLITSTYPGANTLGSWPGGSAKP
jgi:hypothetical protein